jgi:hypothetical protein
LCVERSIAASKRAAYSIRALVTSGTTVAAADLLQRHRRTESSETTTAFAVALDGSQPSIRLPEPEEGQYGEHDHDEADQINDAVHGPSQSTGLALKCRCRGAVPKSAGCRRFGGLGVTGWAENGLDRPHIGRTQPRTTAGAFLVEGVAGGR